MRPARPEQEHKNVQHAPRPHLMHKTSNAPPSAPPLRATRARRGKTGTPSSSAGGPTYLQQDTFASSPLLTNWYRWFTPAPPQGRLATLKEREKIRRSRLASIILAVQLLFIELPVVPVVANAPNHAVVLPWLCGCIVALLVALYANRRGWLALAGLLMVGSIEVTVMIKILTIPGGLSTFYLPQFDILLQPILIAVALLAPWSAFAVAGLNVSFFLAVLTLSNKAPDLLAVLHDPTRVGDLFSVPIMGQILTAFFAFLIVRDLLAALKSADQAEQLASLEFLLAESRREVEHRNVQLEAGIAEMVHSIRQVSMQQDEGTHARVHLAQEHPLWPVGMQLNLFLDRYQRARASDAQLEATTSAIHELANAIYQSTLAGHPLRLPPRRNTPLDAVIIALGSHNHHNQTSRFE
jgi:hypothetical protein